MPTQQDLVKSFIRYGIFYDLVNGITKTFSANFLHRIGGSDDMFFLLNSLPALFSALFLLPSLLLLKRSRSILDGAVVFFIFSRAMLLFLILIPLLPSGMQALVFTIILSLYAMPEATGSIIVQNTVAAIFPSEDRNSILAKRQRYSIPFTIVLVLGLGFVLGSQKNHPDVQSILYQGAFLLALGLSVFEILQVRRLRTGAQNQLEIPFRKTFRELTSNKPFLLFALSALFFYFTWQFGWPLFAIWQIKHLGADESWSAIISLFGSLAMFPAYTFWAKISGKYGIFWPLLASILGMAINPFLIGSSENLYVFAGIQLVTGFFTAGVLQLILSGLLLVSPSKEHGTIYLGLFSMFVLISQIISQEIAHFIASFIGIQPSIFLDGGLRVLAALAFFIATRKIQVITHAISND